ncbi:MAG: hypothetical protein JW751_27380 [Polyangiaceae bacterium]|nr:hypothetical protein [Polyangiaceae bacterium]
MSTPFLCGVTTAWAAAQLALATFFGVAHALRRETERRLFVLVCLAMAVATGGLAGTYAAETISGWSFAADVALAGIIGGGVLNLEFATRFARRRRRSLVPVYVVAALALLLVSTGHFRLANTERVDETILFSFVVRHVSTAHYWYAALLGWMMAASSCVAVAILIRAHLDGRRDALTLVVSGVALAVAFVNDMGLILRAWSHGVYLLPHASMFHAFTIGLILVVRNRETEGRLEAARHSLEERTEELRRSYLDLRLMEGELFRREQLAAVGELAATIAHEVRNPLAIILNAAAGLRRSGVSESDRDMLLGIVDEEVGRLNRLVADLLRFARPVSVSWSDVNLRALVERTRGLVPDGIAVDVSIPEEPRFDTITVDAGLLRLVLENLVENACQAMPDGGQLSIVVRNGRFDLGEATSIEVRDTGRGMDARTLERALKPFFTTRPQGTGLGLAIVDRIVRAHGGAVSLESTVGRGTTVRLLIPLDEEVRRRRRTGSLTTGVSTGG